MNKTPDETKKGLECCVEICDREKCPYWEDPDCTISARKDALALIQQLEAQLPKWISVKDRLPDIDKRLDNYAYSAELLVYDGLRIRAAYYCHTTTWWHDSRYEDDIIEVTHWMPLPEPPKEE